MVLMNWCRDNHSMCRSSSRLSSKTRLRTTISAAESEKTHLLKKQPKEQDCGLFLLYTLVRHSRFYFLRGALCLLFHDVIMFAAAGAQVRINWICMIEEMKITRLNVKLAVVYLVDCWTSWGTVMLRPGRASCLPRCCFCCHAYSHSFITTTCFTASRWGWGWRLPLWA